LENRWSRSEQFIVRAIEKPSGLNVLALWRVRVLLVSVNEPKFEEILEFCQVRKILLRRLSIYEISTGFGENLSGVNDLFFSGWML
jgi:hypothetical protein